MAIRKSDVKAVFVGELLAEKLMIPAYQRPYSWTTELALQLLDDLQDAHTKNADSPYVLGTVILHKHHTKNGDQLDVVDGQQRLLTLRMILFDVNFGNDQKPDSPVLKVWQALSGRLKKLHAQPLAALRQFINTRCHLVRVETDDVDEAFRVFDSQNYRGLTLKPHDLLKAHHLREMRTETHAMQVAVVDTWESVEDKKLDRLFSKFLYRIARWSRGESAPGFGIHDIGMFKGISRNDAGGLSPSARYHLAAQAAMPLLCTFGAGAGLTDRDALRSRFQLDALLVAGRPFFEMVAFMLEVLDKLESEVKGQLGQFDGSKSRYQYVYELFVAALLYYTNKFGHEDLEETRDRLFAWAYALRIEKLRVQFASVDNRARGSDAPPSPFILLRNAMTGRVIRRASTAHTRPAQPPEHEAELIALIKQKSHE